MSAGADAQPKSWNMLRAEVATLACNWKDGGKKLPDYQQLNAQLSRLVDSLEPAPAISTAALRNGPLPGQEAAHAAGRKLLRETYDLASGVMSALGKKQDFASPMMQAALTVMHSAVKCIGEGVPGERPPGPVSATSGSVGAAPQTRWNDMLGAVRDLRTVWSNACRRSRELQSSQYQPYVERVDVLYKELRPFALSALKGVEVEASRGEAMTEEAFALAMEIQSAAASFDPDVARALVRLCSNVVTTMPAAPSFDAAALSKDVSVLHKDVSALHDCWNTAASHWPQTHRKEGDEFTRRFTLLEKSFGMLARVSRGGLEQTGRLEKIVAGQSFGLASDVAVAAVGVGREVEERTSIASLAGRVVLAGLRMAGFAAVTLISCAVVAPAGALVGAVWMAAKITGGGGGTDGAALFVMGALGAVAGAVIGPVKALGWLYDELTPYAREHVGRPIEEIGDDIALLKEAPRLEEVAMRLQEMLSLGNPGRDLHVAVVPMNAFSGDGTSRGRERQPMLLV